MTNEKLIKTITNDIDNSINKNSKNVRRNSTVGHLCFGAGTIVLATAIGLAIKGDYHWAALDALIGAYNLYIAHMNHQCAQNSLASIQRLRKLKNELKNELNNNYKTR